MGKIADTTLILQIKNIHFLPLPAEVYVLQAGVAAPEKLPKLFSPVRRAEGDAGESVFHARGKIPENEC